MNCAFTVRMNPIGVLLYQIYCDFDKWIPCATCPKIAVQYVKYCTGTWRYNVDVWSNDYLWGYNKWYYWLSTKFGWKVGRVHLWFIWNRWLRVWQSLRILSVSFPFSLLRFYFLPFHSSQQTIGVCMRNTRYRYTAKIIPIQFYYIGNDINTDVKKRLYTGFRAFYTATES